MLRGRSVLRLGKQHDTAARTNPTLLLSWSGLPLDDRLETGIRKHFKVGDRVRWNSEAGYVSGRITRIHTRDTEYKGYARHASEDEPQFEIKSDRTDHIAMHKGAVLQKMD